MNLPLGTLIGRCVYTASKPILNRCHTIAQSDCSNWANNSNFNSHFQNDFVPLNRSKQCTVSSSFSQTISLCLEGDQIQWARLLHTVSKRPEGLTQKAMRQNIKYDPEREKERNTMKKAACASVWSIGRIQHTYIHTKPSSLPSVWITLHSDQHSVDVEAQGKGSANPKAEILYRQICSE